MKKLLAFLVMLVFSASVLFSFAASGANTIGTAKSNQNKLTTVSGVIVKINPGVPYNKEMPALKTSETTYILTGNIKNIEKYIGYNAIMTGSTQTGPQGILFFNVKNFKVISKQSPSPSTKPSVKPSSVPSMPSSKPSPSSSIVPPGRPSPIPSSVPSSVYSITPSIVPVVTPSYEILRGYLTSITSDNIRFILKTDGGAYELMGNTKGLESVLGKKLEVTGNSVYTFAPTEFPLFSVVSYKVIEEPVVTVVPVTPVKYVVLKGYLSVLDSEKSRFILRTETGAYELIGNIKGLENEAGKVLEVTGNYVYTLIATEFPLFSVEYYKVIEEPTSTPAPAAIIITAKDNGGYVYVKSGDEVKLVLESNPTTGYSWNFTQKPDEKILLLTNHEYIQNPAPEDMVGVGGKDVWTFKAVSSGTTVMYLSYSRPWESIPPEENFKVKVIVDQFATPTPAYDVLKGTLSVTKVEPLPNAKLISPYNFLLKTEKGPFALKGNVAGLEKYDGKDIQVTGTISPLDIYPPIFNVVSYSLLPTPTIIPPPVYDVLKGTLSVTKVESLSSEKISSPYNFSLKTEKGPFTLLGNVSGLEKYDGRDIEVTGTISPLAVYPPYFNVVSYTVLPTPTVTPVPTPSSTYKTHTVISKAEMNNATISWTEDTKNAFFKAKAYFSKSNVYANYDFELVETISCDNSTIYGYFNVKMDGKLVADKVHGKVYLLDGPVGSYYKFYSDGEVWHISGFITDRIDF